MNRRSLLDLGISQAAPFVGNFVVTFGTASLLGPSGRGELAFITSTGTVAGSVLFGSLHVGTTKAHNNGLAGLRQGAAWAARIIGGGVLLGLLVAVLLPADATIGPVGRPGFVFVVCAAGLAAVNLYVLRSVQGLGEHRAFRNGWAIQSLVYLVLGLPAAVITREAAPVAAAWAVALTLSTAYVMRTYVALLRNGPQIRAPRRTVLRDSMLAHVGTIGLQLLYRADVVILGLLAASHEVGIYSIAIAVAGLIWIVAEAFSLAAFSRTSTDTTTSLHHRDRRLIVVNAQLSAVAAVGLALGSIFLLARILPAYAEAVPLILILLPGVVAQGPARVAFSSLLRRDDARPAMWIGLGSLALSVAYVPAAATWGAHGVAVASTIVYLIQAGGVFWLWSRGRQDDGLPSPDTGVAGSAQGSEDVVV